jgi:hypothetical protein
MLRLIRLGALRDRLDADTALYNAGSPFKHLVFDDLLPPEAGESLAAAFPAPDWEGWDRGRGDTDPYQPKKLTCADLGRLPEPLDRLIWELNSGPFLEWLGKLTGIEHLLPDLRLYGGGLHCTGPGGRLLPHTDFHYASDLVLHRRLNLLVYLNKGWTADNGGAFELWDQHKDRVEREVLPELGRTVIFQTDADSMHGFSKAVAGRYRNSVALYYYTAQAPARFSGDYATHWRLDNQDKEGKAASGGLSRGYRRAVLLSARIMGGIAWRLNAASRRIEGMAGRHAW